MKLISPDLYEKLLDFAETNDGKVALLGVFGILLYIGRAANLGSSGYWTILLSVIACTFAEKHRLRILPLAMIVLLYIYPFTGWSTSHVMESALTNNGLHGQINLYVLRHSTVGAFFIFYLTVLYGAARFKDWAIFRRPVLALVLFFSMLLVLAGSDAIRGWPQVYLWSFVSTFSAYIWFLSYALQDCQSRNPSPLYVQVGMLHPFWGATTAPYGKGAAYIRQVEAKTPRELATSQIKGLKLMLICIGMLGAKTCFKYLTRKLHIPDFEDTLLPHYLRGASYSIPVCWVSLVTAYIEWVAFLPIWGNLVVGCARMAGFNILRSTYKPERATSIAEFFNRFDYYLPAFNR